MGFRLVQKSNLIELDGTKCTWSLLTIKYLFCTEFQRKIFTLLESNAYMLKKLGKEVMIVKLLQKRQVSESQAGNNSPESARIEVIVLTAMSHHNEQ